ncbi:MAG: hypothetical protein ABI624_23900, partial [Casimicrobiaceae bacterium]
MSGPITAGYFCVHGLLVLSARALEEARAMRREYGDVLAQLSERERSLAQAKLGQRGARLERIAAMRGEAARAVARFDRLQSLGEALSARAPNLAGQLPAAPPLAPSDNADAAWAAYLRQLETVVREMETLLASAGSAMGDKLRATLTAASAAPSIDDVLSAYVLHRQMKSGLAAAEVERFRQTAARVLSRLELAE